MPAALLHRRDPYEWVSDAGYIIEEKNVWEVEIMVRDWPEPTTTNSARHSTSHGPSPHCLWHWARKCTDCTLDSGTAQIAAYIHSQPGLARRLDLFGRTATKNGPKWMGRVPVLDWSTLTTEKPNVCHLTSSMRSPLGEHDHGRLQLRVAEGRRQRSIDSR